MTLSSCMVGFSAGKNQPRIMFNTCTMPAPMMAGMTGDMLPEIASSTTVTGLPCFAGGAFFPPSSLNAPSFISSP